MTFENLLNQMNIHQRDFKKFEMWELNFVLERAKELNVKIGFEYLKLIFEIRNKYIQKQEKFKKTGLIFLEKEGLDKNYYQIKKPYKTASFIFRKLNNREENIIPYKKLLKKDVRKIFPKETADLILNLMQGS